MGRRRCVTLRVVLLMHSTRAAIATDFSPGVKQTVAAFSESAIAKPYSQSPAPVAKNNSADILAHQRNFHKLKVVKELISTLFIVLSHVHLKLCGHVLDLWIEFRCLSQIHTVELRSAEGV